MEKTVVLIDPNKAVQTVATLALAGTEIIVKAFAEGAKAMERILELHPDIVLCAYDIRGVDPLALSKEIHNSPELAHTSFVLLVTEKDSKLATKHADKNRVDRVLNKPFKSEQLRSIVFELLRGEQAEESLQIEIGIWIADNLVRMMFEKYISKRGVTFTALGSKEELKTWLERPLEKLLIIEHSKDTLWFLRSSKQPEDTKVVVLFGENESTELAWMEGKSLLRRPLSCEMLKSVLGRHLPRLEAEEHQAPLTSGEQALLAGRIGASVFEHLLTAESLRHGNWQSAAELVRDETIRICHAFRPPQAEK